MLTIKFSTRLLGNLLVDPDFLNTFSCKHKRSTWTQFPNKFFIQQLHHIIKLLFRVMELIVCRIKILFGNLYNYKNLRGPMTTLHPDADTFDVP